MMFGSRGKLLRVVVSCILLFFCATVFKYSELEIVAPRSSSVDAEKYKSQEATDAASARLSNPKFAVEQNDFVVTRIRQDKDTSKRLPHIISIGSKKCGTSTFITFFQFHSRIVIPHNQHHETHFFDSHYEKGVSYYKSLWPNRTSPDQLLFEKTPKYLVSESVPQRILESYRKENLTTPKFVLISCDPVHRAFSDYTQARRKCFTDSKYQAFRPFDTFDHFVESSLAKIRNVTKGTSDVTEFYKHVTELYEDRVLRMLMRGVYSYFLQSWFRTFPRNDFVFVDAGELLRDPGNAMFKAQKKLGLKPELQSQNFEFMPERGFFCMKLSDDNTKCMGDGKGNTRSITNGTVSQSKLSKNAESTLRDFYRPFNEEFIQLSGGLGLDWL